MAYVGRGGLHVLFARKRLRTSPYPQTDGWSHSLVETVTAEITIVFGF